MRRRTFQNNNKKNEYWFLHPKRSQQNENQLIATSPKRTIDFLQTLIIWNK